MLWGLLIIWIVWWLAAVFLFPIKIRVKTRAFLAMTIAPFLFYTSQLSECTLKHERRHWFQQVVLSPPVMLVVYVLHYLILRLKGLDHLCAYWYIVFERDAREKGCNPWSVGATRMMWKRCSEQKGW